MSRLRVLSLRHNRQVTNAGARALAASPHLSRLLRLTLSGHGIDRFGREVIGKRM